MFKPRKCVSMKKTTILCFKKFQLNLKLPKQQRPQQLKTKVKKKQRLKPLYLFSDKLINLK